MEKGSAELPLPDGDFTAKRRAAVGRIDLMKKGLRRLQIPNYIVTSSFVGRIDLMKKGLRP